MGPEYKILEATALERLSHAVNAEIAIHEVELIGPPQMFGHEHFIQAVRLWPAPVFKHIGSSRD